MHPPPHDRATKPRDKTRSSKQEKQQNIEFSLHNIEKPTN